MALPVVPISDIAAHENQEVELRGWLYNKRRSGKLHFLQVRDGTGVIQAVVFKNDVPPEQFTHADHLGQETALIVRGLVKKDARSPIGFELSVKDLEVVSEAKDYPITPKEHGVAYLMEHRHLWLRSAAAERHPPGPGHGGEGHPRLLRRRRLHPRRRAHLHPGRLRGDQHALRGPLLRPGQRLPDPVRPAVHGGRGHGAGEGLLLRPHLPRREEQDPPAPHRVLDGGAGGRLHDPGGGHGARRGAGLLHRGPGPREAREGAGLGARAGRAAS